jgi:hypothetical protein
VYVLYSICHFGSFVQLDSILLFSLRDENAENVPDRDATTAKSAHSSSPVSRSCVGSTLSHRKREASLKCLLSPWGFVSSLHTPSETYLIYPYPTVSTIDSPFTTSVLTIFDRSFFQFPSILQILVFHAEMFSLNIPFLCQILQVLLFTSGAVADTLTVTITAYPGFLSQRSCAIYCYVNAFDGQYVDMGCPTPVENSCYCRDDLIPAMASSLSSCVSASCSGNSEDVYSATSIFEGYCSSNGYVAATPTAAGSGGKMPHKA